MTDEIEMKDERSGRAGRCGEVSRSRAKTCGESRAHADLKDAEMCSPGALVICDFTICVPA